LEVTGACLVPIGAKHYWKAVNILRGGKLDFDESRGGRDSKTEFWATSIIIENGGSMIARGRGVGYLQAYGPFGIDGGTLTIKLYGGPNEAVWNEKANPQRFDKQNLGALCKSPATDRYNGTPLGPCGIPKTVWDSNGKGEVVNGREQPLSLPGGVSDYFYQYGPLNGDARCDDGTIFNNGACPGGGKVGYFGPKVFAVSYGATLELYGYKGVLREGNRTEDPLHPGRSWRRLEDGNPLAVGATELYVQDDDPEVIGLGWTKDDEIVVTTTDYLPGHSEKLQITGVSGNKISFGIFDEKDQPTDKGVQWPHNGTRFGGPKDAPDNRWTKRLEDRIKKSLDPNLWQNGAETRAAVALLTRSIQIVSAGDKMGEEFKAVETEEGKQSYSYGAHMVIRQGFEQLSVEGVEFKQMGQGGRLGHYPVHFHMARKTPSSTRIVDSSINESMTRWIVLHSTQGVRVARNVGYKSIGHGFYLEDGTETDNSFWSNIGIYARAAVGTWVPDAADTMKGKLVANPQNPRMIPGILADNQNPDSFEPPRKAKNPGFPYRSDSEYPTVFWISNGWNDFQGNMAAGAGACGAAYWLVPASNMNMVDVPDKDRNQGVMKWSGYAELQGRPGFGGATPLKSFHRNHATSTMHSLQTTDDAPPCDGIVAADVTPGKRYVEDNFQMEKFRVLKAIHSDAPKPARHTVKDNEGVETEIPDNANDHYYPHVIGGARTATECEPSGGGYDCSAAKVPNKCGTGPDPTAEPMRRCVPVVIDHFTSSFHWAHGNVSAIWLRPQWYLVTNSVITDVQNGGLSFVTGGDYTHSSMINGYWGVVRNTVFVGNTNNNADNTKNNKYASNTGPFNATPASGSGCDLIKDKGAPGYCLNSAAGISMPTSGFFTNQRLLNIYDGPFYQESNAYLDITPADCPFILDGTCMYGKGPPFLLLRKDPTSTDNNACYLPNAAIGWKQPNGFFYPPAFHSENLFFDNVTLRHYVILPLVEPNTYRTDEKEARRQYCNGTPTMFDNWTAIDRQTELNDDDGTLTGLSNSANGHLKQTISINEDSFFSAPIDAPECASAVGANADADKACLPPKDNLSPVTARTSPYDYVTTVIYHKATDETDLWGSDCTNQRCYGVPLFRQYLTDTTDGKDKTKSTKEMRTWLDKGCDNQKEGEPPNPACRWPFIRMAGANISQRNSLTINNGKYYIDTTVSADTQRGDKYAKDPPVALNVFAKDKQYHVFFVYAKQTTKQTYQIYVGEGFDKTRDFELTNVNVETLNFSFLPKKADTNWAQVTNYEKGVLTVEINFAGLKSLDPTPDNGLCAPRSFCKPDNTKICVSNLPERHRLFAESNAVCGKWAIKDLDCPPLRYDVNKNWIGGGCPGFSFTPRSNVADDKHHRPKPESYPMAGGAQPDWATTFKPTAKPPDSTGGRCRYVSLPDRSCPKKP
jgi:cell migration-inducing and hyaluronan-binding protein